MTAKRQWLGILAAMAVAFGALLPFFATYNSHPLSSSLFGDKILICTGNGFALVKLADLESGKAPVKQDKHAVCPLCYLAAHAFNALLPVATVLFLLYAVIAERSVFFAASYPRRLAYAAAYSRAPPFSFIG